MNFDWITTIGFMAAACTTWAFLPQVIKTIKSRETKSISLSMYIVFTLGVFLWLVYGLILMNPPLIIANLITFVLSLTVLILKMKHG